jgi:hypothetical protein
VQHVVTFLLASLGLGAVSAGLATFVRRTFGAWGLLAGWVLVTAGLAIVLWPHVFHEPIYAGRRAETAALVLNSLLCLTLGPAIAVEYAARQKPAPSASRHVLRGIGGFCVGLVVAVLLNLAALAAIPRILRQ